MRIPLAQASAVAVAIGAVLAGPAAFAAPNNSASNNSAYATVISSTPATANVPVPRHQCTEGSHYVQQAPSGARALIGAGPGTVVGNQVDAKSNPVTAVPTRRCQTVTSYETRTVGYDVMYEYAG